MNNFFKAAAPSIVPLDISLVERIPDIDRIMTRMEGLDNLVADQIRRDGGDTQTPIVVGVISGDSDAHVLLEGHVGVAAAEKAGLTELPAIRLVMPDRLSALKVAIQLNCQQNMDDLRFRIVKTMIEIFRDYPEYRPRYGTGRHTDHIAATIGSSARTVQRMTRILESQNADELIDRTEMEDLSVNQAERQVLF